MAVIVRINKKGKKSYQVKVDSQGKQVTKTFKKKEDADAYDRKLKDEKRNGEVFIASRSLKKTLNDFFFEWYPVSFKASDGWKDKQKRSYEKYVQNVIGSIPLLKIKGHHISEVMSNMKKLSLKPQTIKHVYNLLHLMLGDCVEEYGYIQTNPVRAKKHCPKVEIVESEFLYSDEAIALLKHVRGKKYGLGIWIQTLISDRIAEVKYFRWAHVDFKNGEIHVKGTWRKSEKRMIDRPKEGGHSILPIPPELLEYLAEEKAKERSEWVQPSEDNLSKPFCEATYGRHLKRYCNEIGITRNITSHSLRHSTHSILLSNGGTVEELQTLQRHKNQSTTLRYLHGGHRPKEKLDKVMSKMKLFDKSEED